MGHVTRLGNLFELGPLALTANATVEPRNTSWASVVPVLFVDSPVGTGWSRATSYAQSQEETPIVPIEAIYDTDFG